MIQEEIYSISREDWILDVADFPEKELLDETNYAFLVVDFGYIVPSGVEIEDRFAVFAGDLVKNNAAVRRVLR